MGKLTNKIRKMEQLSGVKIRDFFVSFHSPDTPFVNRDYWLDLKKYSAQELADEYDYQERIDNYIGSDAWLDDRIEMQRSILRSRNK